MRHALLRLIPVLVLPASFFITGCRSTEHFSEPGAPPSDYDSPVVLFVSPEPQKLEQLRREYGEDFYTVADDAMWYRSQAYDLLDEAGIPYVHPQSTEAWFDVGGKPTRFSWSEVDRAWFLIFYDGSGEPGVFYDNELPSALEAMGSDRLP